MTKKLWMKKRKSEKERNLDKWSKDIRTKRLRDTLRERKERESDTE